MKGGGGGAHNAEDLIAVAAISGGPQGADMGAHIPQPQRLILFPGQPSPHTSSAGATTTRTTAGPFQSLSVCSKHVMMQGVHALLRAQVMLSPLSDFQHPSQQQDAFQQQSHDLSLGRDGLLCSNSAAMATAMPMNLTQSVVSLKWI